MATDRHESRQRTPDHCDVLVVGAGPTGLTLAAWLNAFGVSVRLVDRSVDRVHESRALAVQPRTLEVLRGLGVANELVRRGNPAVRLAAHVGRRIVRVPFFDIGLDDTAFPYLLFVSQAETEQLLGEHLAAHGVRVERGVELSSFTESAGDVTCTLRTVGGEETVRATYLVGCDGVRSTVREQAGVPFVGGRYPQTFLLADLPADGLETGDVHAFVTDRGPLFFFPLGRPAPWRLLTLAPPSFAADPKGGSAARDLSVADLQELTDRATGGRVQLGEPVWSTAFSVHHRLAAGYRVGRVFLAGDAAHVHSPAGAQGMNTGIQDAWNLGWKLALVISGSPVELLGSYEAERRPVGVFVLRFTDWAFTASTSSGRAAQMVREQIVPRLAPIALRFRPGRAAAFRTVSQLGIRYRRSPAVQPDRRRRPRPRPGDRLPDARVASDGQPLWLHEMLTAPAYHLLLCGPRHAWDAVALDGLSARYGTLLTVHLLDRHLVDRQSGPGVLHDLDGTAHARLHVRRAAQLLVRPDGHVAYRADSTDLTGLTLYLDRWLPASARGR